MPDSAGPLGVERLFDADQIIVSKTDTRGRITYVNRVFMQISGYAEAELLGQPHSLIRHPAMPRCVFQLLWDRIQAKREIFAYVINRCKNGDHYWVFAHVTPSLGADGEILGYHSNRRVPDRRVLEGRILPLYEMLLAEEQRHDNRKAGQAASFAMLVEGLRAEGLDYDEWLFTL
ncbi:MAG: PAS domain S-box protein [Inquilinus sp.]|nr:PAS domain S-box protein [Inquilinus sp.]